MASGSPAVVLTTDFGNSFYVGQLKGVLAELAPRSQVIDLTHEIEPQNVMQGAVILMDSIDCFPKGSIHVAVVDPGVGTERSLVAVEWKGQWLIGPDNGLFAGLASLHAPSQIYRLSNTTLWRTKISSTFHGRDIMAPVAAHLANGGDPRLIGQPVERLLHHHWPVPIVTDSGIQGDILFADRYGNLLTTIRASDLLPRFKRWYGPHNSLGETESLLDKSESTSGEWRDNFSGDAEHCEVLHNLFAAVYDRASDKKHPIRLVQTYGEASDGELVALLGSSGRLEVSVVNGSAGRHLAFQKKSQLQIYLQFK